MKIKVSGYSANEGTREFEILEREELQTKIDNLSNTEVFRRTFEEARAYRHTGTAYTYIDARSGEIKTCWLGSNTTNHPWDSFYEIWLCSLKTGNGEQNFGVEDLLDTSSAEYEKYLESDLNAEDFISTKYGADDLAERIENAISWQAVEFYFDEDDIERQIEELYSDPTE
ncbi:MAG: hypothetical protein M0021_09710 [Clostridia bacterium]|nr:hypothetical protein [Clostridia bacterium]